MLKRICWLIGLWAFASFGSIVGGVFVNPVCYILAFIFPHNKYINNVARASDRLDAAYLGWNGRHLVSTELAYSNSKVFGWMRDGLEVAQPGHCITSAIEEGAYCRYPKRVEDVELGRR